MTDEKQVVIREDTQLAAQETPFQSLEQAQIAAKALMTVVNNKKKPIIVNGEQYLEYEDWQTVGQFFRYSVRTGSAEYIEINGVPGARARADLIDMRSGLVIGGAEAVCLKDEATWGNKPWFQLASMAQTRAGAKAFRNRLSWVVVLAGYKPTPAEEIIEHLGGTSVSRAVDMPHFCKEHNTPFFKRGKMPAYAHPIGDTGTWCNEAGGSKTPPAPSKPSVAPQDAPDEAVEDGPNPDEQDNQTSAGAPRPPTRAELEDFAQWFEATTTWSANPQNMKAALGCSLKDYLSDKGATLDTAKAKILKAVTK